MSSHCRVCLILPSLLAQCLAPILSLPPTQHRTPQQELAGLYIYRIYSLYSYQYFYAILYNAFAFQFFSATLTGIIICIVFVDSSFEELKTASDTQRGGADSDSSIRSLSKAEGKDDSLKEDSISEELEDYTLDETMTEDEMERSFRSILPSESHRKRAKKQLDNVSVTSDEGSVSGRKRSEGTSDEYFVLFTTDVWLYNLLPLLTAPATPRYSMDDLGSFIGEDSFNKFTEEMVKQFMREEELRAQHQVRSCRIFLFVNWCRFVLCIALIS